MTFSAALKIMDGFDLTEDEALSLLLDRCNPRCVPPWTEDELRHKVQGAAPLCQDRGRLLKVEKTRYLTTGPPRPLVCPPFGSQEPPEMPPPPMTKGRAQNSNEGDQADPPADRPQVPAIEWRKRGLFQVTSEHPTFRG